MGRLKQRVEVLEFKQKGGNIQHEYSHNSCNYTKLTIEYHYNVRFLNADESKVVECILTTSHLGCLRINGDYIEVVHSHGISAVYKINRVKRKLDEVDLDLYKKAYYEKPKSIFDLLRGE